MRAFLLHSGEPAMEPLLAKLLFPHGAQVPEEIEKSGTIIHWGAYHPDRGHAEVLQPIRSILLARNKKRAAELLTLHGIECGWDETGAKRFADRWSHEFIVPVFHLQALTLFHRASGVFLGHKTKPGVRTPEGEPREFTEIGTDQPSFYAARAMREAVKAVYALGLDYGIVRLGARSGGVVVVLAVEAEPKLTPRLVGLFADAMNRFDVTLSEEAELGQSDVMLGADPEFLLLNSRGKVTFASNYAEKEGAFGCDAIVLPSRRKIFPLAELRPKPSTDIRELVVNLHRTMQIAAKRIGDPEVRWVAGGMPVRGFPLGGHIHFSGIELCSRLLRVLDNYIALPLTLLEDGTTGMRKPKYGFLGDFRRQRHGGFEYRVLPSWMVSPDIAKGVLALAKVTAEHYRLLNLRPLADAEVLKAYYGGDKARIRPMLQSLWKDLEKVPGYAKYESYLLPLRRRMLQMRPWKELDDIRPKWKITPFT
ncbi:hypothetical protein ACFQI7_12665 [Paenibacillus allorhizosphaerae]|uniref:Phage phiEco32-like COOH-NH2 ligase-type 2 n=1 Tax=Paenibacillus allorhizosphaerae TaxID=2849866 RepID=A0ABN7TNA5_9BACL|nr:hypothetical protein [Paenibacillus allorhizosphaerae]CAG7648428.1 hypothetical protein PAECIP111802_04208 [Paenibacillus allorhizosphaerae]